MTRYILLLFFLFSIGNAYSQTVVPGFYITHNNDTVTVQIKMRKGVFGQATNDFTKEVEVIDSLTGSKKFTPNDIRAYGFLVNGDRYTLFSKPVKKGSYKFLAPVVVGPKTSLYQYGISTSGGGYAMGSNQVFYTFEKADGTYLFLANMLNKKFKSQLKNFYKDNATVQQLIDTKLQYWLDMQKDLKEIVQAANKLQAAN